MTKPRIEELSRDPLRSLSDQPRQIYHWGEFETDQVCDVDNSYQHNPEFDSYPNLASIGQTFCGQQVNAPVHLPARGGYLHLSIGAPIVLSALAGHANCSKIPRTIPMRETNRHPPSVFSIQYHTISMPSCFASIFRATFLGDALLTPGAW